MFHFPTFPPHALYIQARVTPHDWCGVPPFGNPRINARLTAPRGISQPPTSFIGSRCQGIHHAPLSTYKTQKPKKNYTFQRIRRTPFRRQRIRLDARNHYPVLKHHTPPPRWRDSTRTGRVLSQGPIVCLAIICCCAPGPAHYRRGPLMACTPPIGVLFVVLLRKEVIQPHLPVRLPCYDFVPIADPTFDSSLPKG